MYGLREDDVHAECGKLDFATFKVYIKQMSSEK